MPVSITVYDGARTIGGNKILLEDGGSAIFLDFGTSFDGRARYFEEFLAPRSRAGLLDPIHMGLLPPLRGIYRADMEDPDGRVWERGRRFGAMGHRCGRFQKLAQDEIARIAGGRGLRLSANK